MKKIVYVCSPLRGDMQKNLQAAAGYCQEVRQAGFVPYCPHLFYSTFLDDTIPTDRADGIDMGLTFIRERMDPDTDELWVFGARVSEGMAGEICEARSRKITIVNCGPLYPLLIVLDPIMLYRIRFFDKHGDFDDREGVILFQEKSFFTAAEYAKYALHATFRVLDNENLAGWRLFAMQGEKWTECRCRNTNGGGVGFDSGRRG